VERELRDASIHNAFVLAASVMRSPAWPGMPDETRAQQMEAKTEESHPAL
jgi:hypothetical protein